MKKNFILICFIFLSFALKAQVNQNFDGNFCSGITGCWERAAFGGYFIVNDRPSNPLAASICTAASKNTTTPISGTGSLNGQHHSTSIPNYSQFFDYKDTIYSTAKGINGNTVSFKIRFSQIGYTVDPNLTMDVVCGSFVSSYTYNSVNQGTIFNINETIAGSGSGGTIMIVIRMNAFFGGNHSFDIIYDIDDFVTNAIPDLTNPCITAALPIKLTSFYANTINCNTVLNWRTAAEENIHHFEIQHSKDGLNFTTMANLNATNSTSIANYEYIDVNANTDINFYRLVSVENDGRKVYSKIIRQNGCKNNKITVYPNPTKDILNITGIEVGSTIKIINMIGQDLIILTATRSSESINIKDLPSSNYILSIINNKSLEKKNIKFIKQ